VVSFVYADIDYLGLADVWWVDLATGASGGRATQIPFGHGVSLPDTPGSAPLRIATSKLELDIVDRTDGSTQAIASWTEPDGAIGRLDVGIALPDGHESLNVVIPWSDRTFQYTSKHQARPASGTLVVGERSWTIGGDAPAWGVLDVGRGRWPYRTRWNWGGGAGSAGDHIVGLQFGGKWTEGTGFTENGVLVDGRLSKIGRELEWEYDWDQPLAPWRVRDPGGQLDVTLAPRYDKHTKVEALVLGTEVHQVFGTWSGTVTPDDGATIHLDDIQGFAEESRSRW